MALLTILGVGPGDPDLITVAGLKALRHARTVAYPVARPGEEGMAARIAAPWLHPEQRRLPLHFPMTATPEPCQQAWRCAARQLVQAVADNPPVVLLCEGDVSLYASASYVVLQLQRMAISQLRICLIPGVTAMAAAAAATHWPLVFQTQQLLVAPAPETSTALDALLVKAEVLAFHKVGQRWVGLRQALEQRDLLHQAVVAERVGWPDQRLIPAADLPPGECSYFSLVLVRQAWPPVLPRDLRDVGGAV
ncbi:precorrin-2 C(20)-methyltransferase [Candidatus Synechococcus spongiarum]|uniref:Precorrin-2 C(20)-methyltransferase n=2 Tax=Candidatus Synechococcus spongiarum TaxID=431041 RepID=A0A1T1D2I3_9SYNE|nr:precorrin-2 C(20)-methyltransferase [Candidatus Synechococcus spongiarum]MCY4359327.1 precorrin-2 C(20)-methyltransferase [Cyanobacteria bacterium MAG APA_bin_95]OOV35089.1 precorrin-2 C(20)-methyltransferase [Candidatus Synechococcus spongiarum LMB bulk15M]OOV36571.1 precorrin-2 C(20)-methyltransferase [Candidatus Synechococcus spongiarum LMB bulk15N]